jgi:hypothetical protein
MNFSRPFRRFYNTTEAVKFQSLSSYFKDNAQTILTALTMLAGVFAAGVYSVQTAAAMKELEQKNKGQVMALEEKHKGQVMALEEKHKGQVMVLEAKNKGQVMAMEAKNKGQVMVLEEKIKTAKEEAKKEALERLFNVINQSEYESSKKAIQESPIQKILNER